MWDKRAHASEEQYFLKMEKQAVRSLADRIHQKELRGLLAVLPENHNLSEVDLHKILEWKHANFE